MATPNAYGVGTDTRLLVNRAVRLAQQICDEHETREEITYPLAALELASIVLGALAPRAQADELADLLAWKAMNDR